MCVSVGVVHRAASLSLRVLLLVYVRLYLRGAVHNQRRKDVGAPLCVL